MFYGAPPYIFKRARILRKTMTPAEKMLWERLRRKQLKGYKFRRQHPVANYIADFYCHRAKLIVEIDGSYHHQEDQKYRDTEKSSDLQSFGITIIRFTNEEVIGNIEKVLPNINSHLP